jgi:hypothetical protein
MREREMRERVEYFLKPRLRAMLMPSALGLGLAMTTACGAHVQSKADPSIASQGDEEDESPRGDTVAVYSAPTPLRER